MYTPEQNFTHSIKKVTGFAIDSSFYERSDIMNDCSLNASLNLNREFELFLNYFCDKKSVLDLHPLYVFGNFSEIHKFLQKWQKSRDF